MTTNNVEALRAQHIKRLEGLIRPCQSKDWLGEVDALRWAIAALASQPQTNPHIGSSLDDFMREEGIASQPQAAGAGGDALNEAIEEGFRMGVIDTKTMMWITDRIRAATPAPAVAQDDARAVEALAREARVLIDRMDDSTYIAEKTLRAVLALATRPSAAPGPQGERVQGEDFTLIYRSGIARTGDAPTPARSGEDEAELRYWRTTYAPVMYVPDRIDGTTHAQRIAALRAAARTAAEQATDGSGA